MPERAAMPLSRCAQMKVRLLAREGINEHEATGDYETHETHLLTEIDIPAVDSWPEVLLWGDRAFTLVGSPSRRLALYREASADKTAVAKRNRKGKGDGPDRR